MAIDRNALKQLFLDRFHEKFGDKYTFNWDKNDFVNQRQNITAVCPEHGEFEITPYSLLKGRGCPICAYGKAVRKPNYWNDYEHCKEAVLDCANRFQLQKKYQGAYGAIRRNGWKDLIQFGSKVEESVIRLSQEDLREIVNNCINNIIKG